MIIAIFVHDAQTPPTPVALPLTHIFDKSPTGFTLKYPDDWTYAIPTIGVFVLAPTETLNGTQPGPTFTVQRAEPLSIMGTLDSALDRYLQSGPLRTPGRWQITDPAHTIEFDGRDARMTQLEGADVQGTPALHTQIITTSANNSLVYLLITTVPVSKRAAYEPTLDAMLKTVQILE
ncbi:MAG: hypothetical protein GC204_18260 [Chloroflexi bacterium]|nr:hypothetical protein [Chloroflexota bacterium]